MRPRFENSDDVIATLADILDNATPEQSAKIKRMTEDWDRRLRNPRLTSAEKTQLNEVFIRSLLRLEE